MRFAVLAATLTLAAPVQAELAPKDAPALPLVDHAAIAEAAGDVIAFGLQNFASEAIALHELTADACAGDAGWDAVESRYRAAYAAWAAVDYARFGPIEERSAALAINFWPDKKDFVGRALRGAMEASEQEQAASGFLDGQSVAARGFPALERLLFEHGEERCPLAVTITKSLAALGDALATDWRGEEGWAALMLSAGPDNPVYLEPPEATSAAYKAFESGMAQLAAQFIGRPLGANEKPRSKAAEAWRSEQSLSNLKARFEGLRAYGEALFAPVLPEETARNLDRIWAVTARDLDRIDRPLHEAVIDPESRRSVEYARRRLRDLHKWVEIHVAPLLDIGIAFNSVDGD